MLKKKIENIETKSLVIRFFLSLSVAIFLSVIFGDYLR